MTKPLAYDPQYGYKWQILCRKDGKWEHLDYAVDDADKKILLTEYRTLLKYHGFVFKVILLPYRYWRRA